MADNFRSYRAGLSSPASSAVAVTPNDSADLASIPRALYVGGPGDLVVTLADDASSVTFAALASGWHPIRAKRVYATGTTATGIVAVY